MSYGRDISRPYDLVREQRARAGRADPRAAAVRRPHRRGDEHRERAARLPLRHRDLAEVDPYEVATIDAFRRDPERVWGWYGARIRSFLDVEPNPGHVALAALERAGLVRGGRDAEHRHAALARREHRRGRGARLDPAGGLSHLRRARAARGRARAARARARAALPHVRRGAEARRRPLRRAARARSRSARAEQLAREAALLLVVGSSLQVWPVAGLPDADARERRRTSRS